MKFFQRLMPIILSAVAALSLTVIALARTGNEVSLLNSSPVPTTIGFQGSVLSGGQPFSGTGQFKFAIVSPDGAQSYWSNDGTSTGGSQPTAAVALSVTNGIFGLLLGDTTLPGMSQSLSPLVFTAADRVLRVWFSDGLTDFQLLIPDTPLASVPFAFNAATLNGLNSSAFVQTSTLPNLISMQLSSIITGYLTTTLANLPYTYTAGSGLLLDHNQFSVNTNTLQARVSSPCASGYAIRAIHLDGTVTCESILNSGGTITTVNAGFGLSGGGSSGSIPLAVLTDTIQQRVSSACGAGFAIRTITIEGSVICESITGGALDHVIAGAGLSGGGTGNSVTLTVAFAGTGSTNTVAHSDHTHAGSDITIGTIADARIASSIARDSEIVPAIATAGFMTKTLANATFATTSHSHAGGDITSPVATAMLALSTTQSAWRGIQGLPVGFADNVDDNTTYSNGFGLNMIGTVFSILTNTIQARVTGSCPAGQYVRSVNTDGGVVCGADLSSGGTLTAINAGSGLIGGGVTGSVTLSLASTVVVSGQPISRLTNNAGYLTTTSIAAAGYLTRTLADARYRGKYANVIVVAKSGGDFMSIQAAIDSISTASASQPYLVTIAPGVYSETITLKPYVDLLGSGEEATQITAGGSSTLDRGTVNAASDVAIDSLSIINGGHNTYAVGVYASNVDGFKLTRVTVAASGGTVNTGLYTSVGTSDAAQNLSASLIIRDSTLSASGGSSAYGLANEAYCTAMNSCMAFGSSIGITATPLIFNSTIAATNALTNVGIYNHAWLAVGNSAQINVRAWPTIVNTTIQAAGGNSYGLKNEVTASAGNAVNNSDISALPTIQHSTITSMGTTASYGLFASATQTVFYNRVFGSQLIVPIVLQHSTVNANGAARNYGVFNAAVTGFGTSQLKIDQSDLTAATNTISTTSGFQAYVGASHLSGGPVAGGAVTCAGVYDENYSFFASTCP
jgi:hypothetical protein